MTRTMLMDNVYLTYLPSEKFKTSLLSAQMVTPLDKKTAGLNALLVNVLDRGTVSFPDMTAINRELDMLYGARLKPTVRKMGENHVFGFLASCIDNKLLPPGEKVLEALADMMGEMFIGPATKNGRLDIDYMESERANLVDYLKSEMNDKGTYAGLRLMEEMCGSEPYGVHRLGDVREVERISLQKLNKHYQTILPKARLELFYCGSAEEKRVVGTFTRAFAALPRQGCIQPAITEIRHGSDHFRKVMETMDVTQGKLSIGYRTTYADTAANMVMNVMFGGMNGKLFRYVREKLSLCYYCSSSYHRRKGLLTVSSGIQPSNYQKALSAIEEQLRAMQEGKWEPWEFDSAVAYLLNDLRTAEDSAAAMENFIMGQAVAGSDETLYGLMDAIRAVTPEKVMEAARALEPDTIYFLKGKEEHHE